MSRGKQRGEAGPGDELGGGVVDLELQVTMEGPDCQQLITQRVSCLGKAR